MESERNFRKREVAHSKCAAAFEAGLIYKWALYIHSDVLIYILTPLLLLLACFTRPSALLMCTFLFLMFKFIHWPHSCLLLARFTGCRALAVCTFSLFEVICALDSYVRCSLKTINGESMLLVWRMSNIRYVVCPYHDKLSVTTVNLKFVKRGSVGCWCSDCKVTDKSTLRRFIDFQVPSCWQTESFWAVKIDNISC